jgi:hypothetical protein
MTPAWNAVVDALNAHGVHQVGLAVESTDSEGKPEPGVFDSLPDEREMARDTGALAPRGGVDCDGNGTTDIQQGEPLVCTISKPADNRLKVPVTGTPLGQAPGAVHLAPLVVQLAESIPEYRSVSLHVMGGPGAKAAPRVISNPAAPTVNLRADNSLGYQVELTCPSAPTGHTYPLTVAAQASGRTLATTPTTLICDPAPAPNPVLPVAAAAVVVAGAPPQPPPNVNANFNPNPAVNPNVGFAQQDEEQPQLALAESDQGLEDDTTLAMSRRSSDRDAELLYGAAALMSAAAAGYAVRRRWLSAWQHG